LQPEAAKSADSPTAVAAEGGIKTLHMLLVTIGHRTVGTPIWYFFAPGVI
jgi:hypothetical protein